MGRDPSEPASGAAMDAAWERYGWMLSPYMIPLMPRADFEARYQSDAEFRARVDAVDLPPSSGGAPAA